MQSTQRPKTVDYAFGCNPPYALVARSLGGGRVNVVGPRLTEDEEEAVPLTRMQKFKRKLAEIWSSVAGV